MALKEDAKMVMWLLVKVIIPRSNNSVGRKYCLQRDTKLPFSDKFHPLNNVFKFPLAVMTYFRSRYSINYFRLLMGNALVQVGMRHFNVVTAAMV